MKRLLLIAVALMLALPGAALAKFQAGDQLFTLSGTGSSDEEFDNTTLSVEGSYGYFYTPALEALIRQTFTYADVPGGDDDWRASTAIGADFHFDLNTWQPFLGAAIGYSYGDGEDDFFIGPEAGVKAFVTDTAFVQALVQYQWFFDEIGNVDEGTDDGNFLYALGLGVKF